MVRFGWMPIAFSTRTASMATTVPAPLSVAPVPACHESRCAPNITTSPFLSVPGISAIVLNVSAFG